MSGGFSYDFSTSNENNNQFYFHLTTNYVFVSCGYTNSIACYGKWPGVWFLENLFSQTFSSSLDTLLNMTNLALGGFGEAA